MRRRLAWLAAFALTGCVMARPVGPGVSVAGGEIRVAGATGARPVVEGTSARFPAGSGSVVVDLANGAMRNDTRAADLARGFAIADAPDRKQLCQTIPSAPARAVSSGPEEITGFDAAEAVGRAGAWHVAWCGRAGNDVAVRAATIDANGTIRTSRVPFDPSWAFASIPTVSAIGAPEDGSFVVAYEAAPSDDSPRHVRLARFITVDGSALRGGAPKPVAYRMEWSRAPAVAASGSFGLVAFEGAMRDEEPGIFIVAIDALGDVDGGPIQVAPLHEGDMTRARPAPFRAAGKWYLAWEETGAGRREVVVAPLRVE